MHTSIKSDAWQNGAETSDSVNLGSNPSPPATTNADETGVSGNLSPSEKPELAEQTAHTGRTKVGTLAERVRSRADADRETLRNLSGFEAEIADAATRIAYDRAGDWLSSKQAKAEQFPGGDPIHAKGRAAAYQNAAQELYGWAIGHGEEP
jgi:hypothetical protein